MSDASKRSLCQFDPETLKCPRCGYQAKSLPTYRACKTVEEMTDRFITEATTRRIKVPPIPIGDAVGKGLAAVGITEDRYKKVTGKKECGCSRRKKFLNRVGAGVSAAVERVANAAINAVLPVKATDEEYAAVAQAIANEMRRGEEPPETA